MKAWLLVLIVAVIAQVFAWLWQRRTGNATLVDAVWAFGVGVSAMLLALLGQGANLPRLLLATLAGVWGLRLGLHLLRRALHESEDGRYAHLRAHWGNDQRKWFGFFMGQALLIALFALPLVPVAANPEGIFGISDFFAIAIWLIAIAGEWQADAQLARFRANPEHRGQVCRSGWWRYSRHPNYFFEWLHWFAYPLLAGRAALVVGVAGAGCDLRLLALVVGHSVDRGAIPAQSRRGLPRISAHHFHFDPMVSKGVPDERDDRQRTGRRPSCARPAGFG